MPLQQIDPNGLIIFHGCSQQQEEQLTRAFQDFCSKIDSRTFWCCMRNAGLSSTLQKICTGNKLEIYCEHSNRGNCKDACGWTHLFRTIDNRPIIHLCPDGLAETAGCPSSGCTIIHEMTHTTNWHNDEWHAQKVEVCAGCPPTPEFPNGAPPWNE